MPKTGTTLITTSEAARRLKVDVRTIHRAVDAGRLTPVHKQEGLRGAYLFAEDDITRAASRFRNTRGTGAAA